MKRRESQRRTGKPVNTAAIALAHLGSSLVETIQWKDRAHRDGLS